jgi:hypothetical protein
VLQRFSLEMSSSPGLWCSYACWDPRSDRKHCFGTHWETVIAHRVSSFDVASFVHTDSCSLLQRTSFGFRLRSVVFSHFRSGLASRCSTTPNPTCCHCLVVDSFSALSPVIFSPFGVAISQLERSGSQLVGFSCAVGLLRSRSRACVAGSGRGRSTIALGLH